MDKGHDNMRTFERIKIDGTHIRVEYIFGKKYIGYIWKAMELSEI